VLRVGLTGGIGAGKSTVATLLRQLGAVLVDADVLAREAVAAGSDGLAAVVAEFGPEVLTVAGELDRPALGRVVFGDPARRAALNAIVHPRVQARRAELAAQAPADAIVVEDIPLLVETGAAPTFPIVVVVHADASERERRLVTERGMSPQDARARIAAQASDEERRGAADVLLPNPRRVEGVPDPLPELVRVLWAERLLPFETNLRAERASGAGATPVTPAVRARLAQALGTDVTGTASPLLAVGWVATGPDVYGCADPALGVVLELARTARVGGPS